MTTYFAGAGWWRSDTPTTWPGGRLDAPTTPIVGPSEWGYLVVPTGVDPDTVFPYALSSDAVIARVWLGQYDDTDTVTSDPYTFTYVGWKTYEWDGSAFHPSSDHDGELYAPDVPAGDLYTYAYPVTPGGVDPGQPTAPTALTAETPDAIGAAPVNDGIAGAIDIGGAGAGTETVPDIRPATADGGLSYDNVANPVWFRWSPAADSTTATFSTAGSDVTAFLNVWSSPTATATHDDLTLVTDSVDGGDPYHALNDERIVQDAEATVATVDPDLFYYVQAGSFWSKSDASFTTSLVLNYPAGITPPAIPATRTRGAVATISVTIPPVETDVPLIKQTNFVMPLPELDANGQVDPDAFVATSITTSNWGRYQVVMGGVDVSVLRGVPTEVVSYSNGQPFGDMACVLRFPGISPFEGAGALSTTGLTMFAGNPDVTVRRVREDGTVDPTEPEVWQGFLGSDDDSVDGDSWSGLKVTCIGAGYQPSLQGHQPSFSLNSRDIGTVIPEIFNSALGRRYATMAPVVTGIPTRKRGGPGYKLEFVQELLGEAVTEDGGQWTVDFLKGRKPVLVMKDMDTVHYEMTTGTPGLKIDMRRDRTQATNAVYGEGVAPDQCRWRNTRYPANGKAFFRPLAELASTQPYLYDEDGNITGPNPIFDPRVIRVERWEQFGEGVTPGQGVTSAQGEISRANQVDFAGTLTLQVDPETGSRFAMRAGQNLLLKQYRGGHRLLHISKVDVNVQTETVTLTVDSQARDLMTLAQVRRRNREATDPARALVGRRTQSRTPQDQRSVWDCENGAGTIPPSELVAGWNVVPVPTGEAGSIVRTETSTSPPTRASVSFFGRPVTVSQLNRLAPTPLFVDAEGGSIYDSNIVALEAAGWLIGFGGPANALGYKPGSDPDSGALGAHTLTGDDYDGQVWEYSTTRPPTLWMAVWVGSACTITGRLYQSVNGG